MRIVDVNGECITEESFSSKKDLIMAMHKLGERYLSHVYRAGKLTTDMDGVIIYDDGAMTLTNLVGGEEAEKKFSEYAGLNIKAVSEGQTCYCWYAPSLFGSQLLEGLSPEINREVGKHLRLIPGIEEYMDRLIDGLGYDVSAVTAGHQEAAEEVSRRVGIDKTVGIQLGVNSRCYDGTIVRFIGGEYKLGAVEDILVHNGRCLGTHVGDSWSDIETLAGIPNSIAFNPGCELALKNAKISIMGVSQLGLLPFFDYMGKYDEELKEEDLPQTTIIMQEGSNGEGNWLSDLLQESRKVKKEVIRNIIDQRDGPSSKVEERIRHSLVQSGTDFQTKLERFMDNEEFDAYAKKAYAELEGEI
ncbi:haloacid dehalogenase-like hydrolase [Candidatus Woesearchaeota archaeon]|nr:haloacid dehalogenase-like hydrolase [Candidatus Woesearchaeota archaeon]